jgi:hypothetical protein
MFKSAVNVIPCRSSVVTVPIFYRPCGEGGVNPGRLVRAAWDARRKNTACVQCPVSCVSCQSCQLCICMRVCVMRVSKGLSWGLLSD